MVSDLVSIITPVFNREELISATINSVLRQSYENWELIILDDNSTDNTLSLIKGLQKRDSRINIYVKPQECKKGPASSRNIGVSLARGDYVIYLDSDDLLLPECLQNRINIFNQNRREDFLVFPQVQMDERASSGRLINSQNSEDILTRFLKLSPQSLDVPWLNTAPIWKLSAIKSFGLRWQDDLIWDDVVYHVNALSLGMKFQFIESLPDCIYRVHKKSREGEKIHQVTETQKFHDLFEFFLKQLKSNALFSKERRLILLHSYFHILILRLIDAKNYELADYEIDYFQEIFDLDWFEYSTLKSFFLSRRVFSENKYLTYYTNKIFRKICSDTYFKSLNNSYLKSINSDIRFINGVPEIR